MNYRLMQITSGEKKNTVMFCDASRIYSSKFFRLRDVLSLSHWNMVFGWKCAYGPHGE